MLTYFAFLIQTERQFSTYGKFKSYVRLEDENRFSWYFKASPLYLLKNGSLGLSIAAVKLPPFTNNTHAHLPTKQGHVWYLSYPQGKRSLHLPITPMPTYQRNKSMFETFPCHRANANFFPSSDPRTATKSTVAHIWVTVIILMFRLSISYEHGVQNLLTREIKDIKESYTM